MNGNIMLRTRKLGDLPCTTGLHVSKCQNANAIKSIKTFLFLPYMLLEDLKVWFGKRGL
jgi:hypothetical protein